MTADYTSRVAVRPSTSAARRLFACMWRQAARNVACPAEPRLDGRIALVTGGGRGIGLETSRGLAVRGAEVVIASRGEDAGRRIARELAAELGAQVHFAPLDLADLERVPATLDRLETQLGGRRLDVLVANAGLWPTRHGLSAQGHEIAFATNALGHHALVRGLLDRELLADRARVVVLTGDIYVLSDTCTADYTYRGRIGGQLAYCRSKLGNLWYVRELARRFPNLHVYAVHPGVVASELGGVDGGIGGWVKRRTMIPLGQGAQTSLFCATQPDLPSGSYYHNVLGRMELDPADAAANDEKARAFWETLERLCEPEPASR